jgi:uncharacterized coiled-coil DUF342 family protein
VPPRLAVPDRADQEERQDRARLRELDARLTSLLARRRELFEELRHRSAEQKEALDRVRGPESDAEALHERHVQLGRRLNELRAARDGARRKVDEAVIHRRELLLTFDRREHDRPELIKREIAELELRQQTRALPIDEENALIARLRQRARDLKEAEARGAQVEEHARLRKEADAAVEAAREEVAHVVEEMGQVSSERDATRMAIRTVLESAGSRIAELRVRGKERYELMGKIDEIGREIAAVEREGRELLSRTRARRAEVRETVSARAPRRGTPPEDLVASAAEARFAELMRQGKVSLGG